MSVASFPVAWQSGPHRFVGKAYVDVGQLHLSGASTGIARRRRTIRIDGCDITGVSTRRVGGHPGLSVGHSFGRIELELLAGSWGAARELADAIARTAGLALGADVQLPLECTTTPEEASGA